MEALIGVNPLGKEILLPNGAKDHILRKHREMRDNMNFLKDAVERPDKLIRNTERKAYISIKKHPQKTRLWIVVIYGEEGRVRTAYKTSKPHKLEKQGVIISQEKL